MKGSLLWKLMYVLCALAGMLAGYGVYTLTSGDEIKPNTITKDNTLVRDAEDSVFFDGEKEEGEREEVPSPTATVPPVAIVISEMPEKAVIQNYVPTTPESEHSTTPSIIIPTAVPEPIEEQESEAPEVDTMPSLASQWVLHGPYAIPTPIPVITPSAVAEAPEMVDHEPAQSSVTEVITYPAEIFGQVPVINRSDAYVSYFEFAYDLIAMLEPEVEARGLNMNSLLAKFVIKALFCGVDIEKLDINAPIPRRLAALCLWLAAQVLEEEGSDTSAKSAPKYVTDIDGCSSAEKKAVAYLYEKGILKGYQITGQKFYPDSGLKTESGTTWLSRVKQCWK